MKQQRKIVSQTLAKFGASKAPAVYRPQPVPRVLQRKTANTTHPQLGGPIVQRPEPKAIVMTNPKKPPVLQPKAQARSSVVQAVKYYPNLHPGAIEPVDKRNIFRLNSFAGQYRLHKQQSHGVNVPNQQYNFVRTREGETLLHSRYRHPSIAEGKHVLYAGEIFFNNGQLEWWSNGSGHYQPDVEDAGQANLPMDQFYPYQQVIKGEHKRRK